MSFHSLFSSASSHPLVLLSMQYSQGGILNDMEQIVMVFAFGDWRFKSDFKSILCIFL